MKKVLIALLLVVTSIGAFAQKGEISGHAKLGYQSDYKRFGVGVEARYEIVDDVRLAPDVTFFFPKDKVWGADVNLNVQYTFNLVDKLTLYPLAGLNISNNRAKYDVVTGNDWSSADIKKKSKSVGFTNWGFNLGAGADYDITPGAYLNFEIKYTLSKADFGQFMFGYGLRF